jgi:hypothetical protein
VGLDFHDSSHKDCHDLEGCRPKFVMWGGGWILAVRDVVLGEETRVPVCLQIDLVLFQIRGQGRFLVPCLSQEGP